MNVSDFLHGLSVVGFSTLLVGCLTLTVVGVRRSWPDILRALGITRRK